jgi:light-regulated signal transduction histidine kinase (bacteriophytochrome)
VSISLTRQALILWFRPEIIRTVNWAGNPDKPKILEEDGTETLTPRKSFKLWQQMLQQQSQPWKPWEIEGAVELRSAIVGIVLRKLNELAEINLELERSNTELDAFAYIASHDLKEPLRGIHNYSNFLLEDYAEVLDAEGVDKLHTLIKLTKRMEDLINAEGMGAGDDQADAGTKTFEREHEMSLVYNARDMVIQTERALERIDNKTYGRCEECENSIGKARLQVFPRATLCMSCKQKEERR